MTTFQHSSPSLSMTGAVTPKSFVRANECRSRGQLKCDGTCAETRFRLLAKRTSPFKSAGASVKSTTGSQGMRINGSNAGYAMFRCSVKSTGYTLHSPVSPSLPPTPRASQCAITFQLESTIFLSNPSITHFSQEHAEIILKFVMDFKQ